MSGVSFERWGRNVLSRWIGTLFPVQKLSPEALQAEWSQGRIRKVLLVRPHQGLGDLLLASPIFRALKTAPQKIQLHFLADTYNTLAVQGNPHLDAIKLWNKKRAFWPGYLWSFSSGLRREKYDLVIVVSSHIPSFTSFLLARLSGARIVLSYETQPYYDGATWSHWLASVQLKNPPAETPEWVKFMDLARAVGVEAPYEPEFHVGAAETQWAQRAWEGYAFPTDRPIVGIYLGGNPDRPERLWPAQAWSDLAKRLNEHRITVLAIVPPEGMISGSGRPEPGIYDEFCTLLGRRPPVFQDRDVVKVAAFLTHLNLFVCPDGGLMHIAIAARVPTLGLCFETDPDRWVPPVSWAVGLRAKDARSSGLLPETVDRVIQERLSLAGNRVTL